MILEVLKMSFRGIEDELSTPSLSKYENISLLKYQLSLLSVYTFWDVKYGLSSQLNIIGPIACKKSLGMEGYCISVNRYRGVLKIGYIHPVMCWIECNSERGGFYGFYCYR
jgi:hypothetical protein